VDAGDLVQYSVFLTHSPSSTSLLHDVAISDVSFIPGSGLAYDSSPLFKLRQVEVLGVGVVFNASSGFVAPLYATDPSIGLLLKIPSIDVGASATAIITVEVLIGAEANATIGTNTSVEFRMQPEAISPLAPVVQVPVVANPEFEMVEPVVSIAVHTDGHTSDDNTIVPGQTVEISLSLVIPEGTMRDAVASFELNPPGILIPAGIAAVRPSSAGILTTCPEGFDGLPATAEAVADGSRVTISLCRLENANSNNLVPDSITVVLRTFVSSDVEPGDEVTVLGTVRGAGNAPAAVYAPTGSLKVFQPLDLIPQARFPELEISTEEPYSIVVDIVPQFANLSNSAMDVLLAVIVPSGFIDVDLSNSSVLFNDIRFDRNESSMAFDIGLSL